MTDSPIEHSTPDRNAVLEEAARGLLDRASDTYKARNGRVMGIQADDGEKCWIVHSDDIEDLRRALTTAPEPADAVSHPMARCIHCGQMHVEHDRVGNTYICAGTTGVHFQAALQTINERGNS